MTRTAWPTACASLGFLLLMHVLPLDKLGTGYIEQQWLIDYSSGFIRRGLFGELWSQLHAPAPYLYAFFSAAVSLNYLLCAGALFFFCFKPHKLPPAAVLAILASPLLWAAIGKLNGRFDIIFNSIFIALLLIRPHSLAFAIALLLTPVLGLTHELWLILYMPMLGMFFLLQGRRYQASALFFAALAGSVALISLTALPPADITALCAHITGGLADMGITTACTRENVETSFQSLRLAVSNSLLGVHGLSFPGTLVNALEFAVTMAYITIAASPLLYVLHAYYTFDKSGRLYAAAGLLLALLLCLIALDWGRFYVTALQLALMGVAIGGYLRPRPVPQPVSRGRWLLCFLISAAFVKLPMSRIILPL